MHKTYSKVGQNRHISFAGT